MGIGPLVTTDGLPSPSISFCIHIIYINRDWTIKPYYNVRQFVYLLTSALKSDRIQGCAPHSAACAHRHRDPRAQGRLRNTHTHIWQMVCEESELISIKVDKTTAQIHSTLRQTKLIGSSKGKALNQHTKISTKFGLRIPEASLPFKRSLLALKKNNK